MADCKPKCLGGLHPTSHNILHNAYLHVLVDVGRGLGPVTAELAGEGLAVRVPVLDMAVEVGLVGAGHLALGALVVVDVRAHVVAEVAEEREHLLTVGAPVRHLRDRRLPLAVVVELGSVGEQASAPVMNGRSSRIRIQNRLLFTF